MKYDSSDVTYWNYILTKKSPHALFDTSAKKKKVFQNDQRLRIEKVSNEGETVTQCVRNFHPEILVVLTISS